MGQRSVASASNAIKVLRCNKIEIKQRELTSNLVMRVGVAMFASAKGNVLDNRIELIDRF